MDDRTAIVYMNRGWWVAMCPRPYCDHAEFFGVATNGAGAGGLTPDYMLCGNCQGSWAAKWPDAEMRKGIEQFLAERPNPVNRNWIPGESLADLQWENATHGIAPPPDAIEAAKERGGGIITATSGGEITAGARTLTAAPSRLSIGGSP